MLYVPNLHFANGAGSEKLALDLFLLKCVVLIDFDGTMTTIDTAEFALDKFADKNWRKIDEQLERGEITFEESLEREFAMLKVPKEEMLEALEDSVQFRPNVDKLIDYCKRQRFPMIVVSGGLDYCIRHFLESRGWLDISIVAPESKWSRTGILLKFPKRFDETSSNLKDDLVKFYKKRGERVVYIGNGIGDYPAARVADLAFAIKGSKLAELCRDNGVRCTEINDFQQVVESIESWIASS